MAVIERGVWELIWQAAEGSFQVVVDDKNQDGLVFPTTREIVLEVIYSDPQGVMVKEIAQRVKRSPAAISKIIQDLFNDGMVERKVSEGDRRAVRISCTSMGLRQREKNIKRLDSYFAEILRPVNKRDKDSFFRVLRLIAQQFPDCLPLKRYSYFR